MIFLHYSRDTITPSQCFIYQIPRPSDTLNYALTKNGSKTPSF